MDKGRWEKISRIFDVALTMNRERRTTYIRNLCIDDPELRQEVEQLLNSLEESEGLLEQHMKKNEALLDEFAAHLEKTASKVETDLSGQTIGGWKLVELLGRGGMGSVYRAERVNSDIKQTGALKIMHQNLNTPENVQRFKLEQQILAGLQHPNIASLIEGGISNSGLPYLVMEYVEGMPLLEYCDTRDFTIEKRLQLFLNVCEAVQHAHKNLIIHRDLKPENILVTEEGHIKILDFGIAKLLDPDLYGFTTVETRQGVHLVSLDYAAPEQVSTDAVTTSTDQYALGILLYELLAGVHPFDYEDKSYRSIIQIIRDVIPASPSRKVNQRIVSEQFSDVAGSRSVQPARLVKSLKGDLDAIVLKAVRKEPDHRYNSVDQLKEDVSNYLQDKPVLAREKVVQYRVKKFVRRHRWSVTAAAIALLSLVGGLSMALWQAEVAETERDRAQLETAKAREVTDFMLGLFEASDPTETRGNTLTARELLDQGVERVKTLDAQPAVQAEMLDVMGQAYRNLAFFEEAESLMTQALTVSRQTYGEAHPEVANNLRNLGNLYQEEGHYRKADSLYQMALKQQRRLLDEGHPDIAETLSLMGSNRLFMSSDSTDIQAAEAALREAIAIHRKQLGDTHPDLADDLIRLSRVMYFKEDRQTQEDLLRRALGIQRDQLGRDHPDVAATKSKLGLVLYNAARYDEAEVLHREALATRREIFGDTHPLVGLSLNNLALTLSAQGDYDRSIELFEKALVLYRKAHGEYSPKVAGLLNNTSQAYIEKGEYDKAEAMQRESLQINIKHNGPDSPITAGSYYALGITNWKQGDLDEAEAMIRKSLTIDRRLGYDLYTAWDLNQLALVEQSRGNFAAAESLRKEGISYLTNALPENHHHIASALNGLAKMYITQERYREAEPLLRRTLAIRTAAFGKDDFETAETQSLLGACLIEMQQYEEAEKLLTVSYNILDTKHHREEWLETLQRLTDLYEAWNRPTMATAYRDTLLAFE